MFYPNLKFPHLKNRPYFYTNFVQTIDGKTAVSEPGYWPIGSKTDYKILLELREKADCLVHGGELARQFGEITLKNFKKPYFILTKHPKDFKNLNTHIITDFKNLIKELKDYKYVLVEGGPTLLGSFMEKRLIDEIFLTIAPKIIGSRPNSTKTLIEGILLPPDKFKLKLISVKKIKDELFLRYRVS